MMLLLELIKLHPKLVKKPIPHSEWHYNKTTKACGTHILNSVLKQWFVLYNM